MSFRKRLDPWRITLRIALSIGLIELAIMLMFAVVPVRNPVAEGFLDAVLLSLLASIVIQKWVLTPIHRDAMVFSEGLITAMSEGMVVQDESGKITSFNKSATTILGLSADELSGRSSIDSRWKCVREDGSVFPGEEHPAMVAIKSGKAQLGVIMGVYRKDGKLVWILVNALPFSANGKEKGVLTTFSDVTEQRNSRMESVELSERLSAAVRALRLGVWDWNLKTGVLVWDEFMYELFQIRKEDFTGDYDAFEKTLLPEDAARVQSELKAVFAKRGADFRSQFRVRTASGNILHIAAAAHCSYDSKGNIERLVGNNWDISNEVRDKEIIAEQNAKLIESSKMASLGVLSAGVAHEINNPLQMIQMAVDLMSKEPQDAEKISQRARTISKAVERISAIISGLRKYSRMSTGTPHQPVVLGEVVGEALELTQSKALRHKVEVSTNIRSCAQILGDELELGQVVINLVNNSIDAVANLETRWVRLDLDESADGVCLRVTDSGPGIPFALREKIFDPFFTTKPVGSGTGIGLSIVKGIVDSHRGTIQVASNSTNTCFEIRFPRVIAHA